MEVERTEAQDKITGGLKIEIKLIARMILNDLVNQIFFLSRAVCLGEKLVRVSDDRGGGTGRRQCFS